MKFSIPLVLLVGFLDVFGMDKAFMTKEMLDNDIETNEYQFFYTKTIEMDTSSLTPKIVYEGKISGYYEFLDKEKQALLKLSTEGVSDSIRTGLSTAQQSVQQSIQGSDILKSGLQGMGIGLIVNPLAKMAFGDDQYAQVVDYYDNDKHMTRVIKFIVSDESLPEKERNMIYNNANERSHHFNTGKAASMLDSKSYESIISQYNKDQL